jgi:hypothetical protein
VHRIENEIAAIEARLRPASGAPSIQGEPAVAVAAPDRRRHEGERREMLTQLPDSLWLQPRTRGRGGAESGSPI